LEDPVILWPFSEASYENTSETIDITGDYPEDYHSEIEETGYYD
jgi:hypothetical protein